MKTARTMLQNRRDGATSVEYCLMAVCITVAIALAVAAFGGSVLGLFQTLVGVWPAP